MAKIIINEEDKKFIKKTMYLDPRVSLENRGLIATIFVLQKGDNLDICELSKISGVSEWAIRNGLLSLENAGLLKRKRVNRDGRIQWDFLFSLVSDK